MALRYVSNDPRRYVDSLVGIDKITISGPDPASSAHRHTYGIYEGSWDKGGGYHATSVNDGTPLYMRMEMRPGDVSPWDVKYGTLDRQRVELFNRLPTDHPDLLRVAEKPAVKFSFSMYVEPSSPVVHGGPWATEKGAIMTLAQFHASGSGHPLMQLRDMRTSDNSGGIYLNNDFINSLKTVKIMDANEFEGRWHHFEWEVKFSTSSDGYYRFWLDGDQIVNQSGIKTVPDGRKDVYFHWGPYASYIDARFGWDPDHQGPRSTSWPVVKDIPPYTAWYTDLAVEAVTGRSSYGSGPSTSVSSTSVSSTSVSSGPGVVFDALTRITSQDVDTNATTSNGGTTVTLADNTWVSQRLAAPIKVTSDTVAQVRVNVSDLGEIQGIGFDDDAAVALSGDAFEALFQLAGTQVFGAFDRSYAGIAAPGRGFVDLTIDLGAFAGRTITNVHLINDQDASGTAKITIEDLEIDEVADVADPGAGALLWSTSASRSNPSALQGAALEDDVFVFLVPSSSAAAEVDQVLFYLRAAGQSTTLQQTENWSPWDFRGGTENTAGSWDTTKLADGDYVLSSEIRYVDGSKETLSASFEIDNLL